MSDNLREEIEATLRDAEYMAHCGKEIEALLQRCLYELEKVPEEGSITKLRGEVKCRSLDRNRRGIWKN